MKKPALIQIILIVIATVVTTTMNIPETKAATPKIAISKVYNLNQTGITFLVNITVTDVTEMGGWVISLSWDPNITRITTGDPAGLYKRKVRYNIHEGDFMLKSGGTNFLVNAIDNTNGTITSLACLFKVAGFGIKGSGLLASINFTLINVGTSAINITSSMLLDRSGRDTPHDAVDGLATDQSSPPEPPVWTKSWFQTLIVTVIIVVVIPTCIIVRLSSKPAQTEADLEKISEFTEEEVEGKPLPEDSE